MNSHLLEEELMVWVAKRARPPAISLTNHGLVRMLIINTLLQTLVTWLQFIELPSNELTEMLSLQPTNLEEIRPKQEAVEERIEGQQENFEQEDNWNEIAEPIEETKLAQEEDYANLLVEASYIPNQAGDPKEMEGSQEEE